MPLIDLKSDLAGPIKVVDNKSDILPTLPRPQIDETPTITTIDVSDENINKQYDVPLDQIRQDADRNQREPYIYYRPHDPNRNLKSIDSRRLPVGSNIIRQSA